MNRGLALLRSLRAQDSVRPFTLAEIDGLQREVSRIASRERLKDREYRERLAMGREAARGRVR